MLSGAWVGWVGLNRPANKFTHLVFRQDLTHTGAEFLVRDLGSTNGTYVNDEYDAVGNEKPRRLFNGDRLRMGDFEFVSDVALGKIKLKNELDHNDLHRVAIRALASKRFDSKKKKYHIWANARVIMMK